MTSLRHEAEKAARQLNDPNYYPAFSPKHSLASLLRRLAGALLEWRPISEAPDDGQPILTGFKGQFHWVYFVDPAHGEDTGHHQAHAKPTDFMLLPSPPAPEEDKA